MASLPSAHASQTFGRRSIHFYAAPGQVIGADPRSRADERRLMDSDGEIHVMRLAHARFPLEPGDFASVIRMQSGPKRKSRPVAVVHHDQGGWERTHPPAPVLLSRAGVSRSFNWTLTALALLAALIACAYLPILAFLRELFPTAFAGAPAFDVFARILERAPGFADMRLGAIAPGFIAGPEQISPTAAAWADFTGYVLACLGLGVAAYAARSWRLVWAPAFILIAVGGAIGLGGVENAAPHAVGALTAAVSLFVIAGALNRARDAARLEARIETLAEHLLQRPPEEMVMIGREAASAAAPSAVAAVEPQPAVEDEPLTFEDDAFVAPPEPEPETPAGTEPARAQDDTPLPLEAPAEAADDGALDVPEEPARASGFEPAAAARDELGPVEPEPAEIPVEPESDEDAAPSAANANTSPEADGLADDAEDDAKVEAAVASAPPASDAQPEPLDETPRDIDAEAPVEPDGTGVEDELPSGAEENREPAALEEAVAPARPYRDPSLEERAMMLPPPPPMPSTIRNSNSAPRRFPTQAMTPSGPLPDNVVPIFSAPPSPKTQDAPRADAAERKPEPELEPEDR